MQFQATVLPVREIARELRVSGLVECTVLAIGDAVRLTVSLLDASRDAQVWGDSYQRPSEDVFQLGRDAALGIAEKLLPVVTAEDRARVATLPTDNREAYSLYQRAREVWSRMGEDNFRMAIELLNQAIALDSTFALAHALKARVFMDGGDLGGSPSLRSTDYREAARASVERALDLDPLLAEGHATLGELNWYHEYDYAAGERESRQAVALDSANALAWAGYGFSQSLSGRDEEAVAALRRAVELDPKDRTLLGNLVWILNVARRYKEAREESREARRLFPEGWNFYLNEAIAALYLGDSTEAVRLQEQASDLHAHPHDLATLGRFYASVGRRQEALAMLDSLKAMAPEGLVNPRSFGYIYMGLDSLDAALDWFIRAAEERDPGLNVNLRAEDYDGIRDHPRYPELLRALRLER